LVHNLFLVYYSWYIYQSLHVSDDYVPIISRKKCVFATISTCYSVWMTAWYAGWNEHSFSSWLWTQSRPKHVKIDKQTKNKLYTKLVLFTILHRDARSRKHKIF